MPTIRQTLPTSWDASARVDGSTSPNVLISDTQGRRIFFAITSSTTAPAFAVTEGHPIVRGGTQGITLASGEYLWIAAETEFDCTLTSGSA